MDVTSFRILMVDDDEEDYLIIREMLSRSNHIHYILEWAGDFESGRQALHSRLYDAVLMDYDLGPFTGLDLIREAVATAYPGPMILLTGRGSYEVDVEAMLAGATLYLTKAEVNPLLLERSIRYAIERKRIEEELQRQTRALEAARAEVENEKRLLEAVMEALPVGVAITDLHGASLRTNRAFNQVWGGPRPVPHSFSDYAAYQAWWADTGELLRPEEWASMQALQCGKPVFGQVLQIQRFDGSQGYVINSAAPVCDAQGKLTGSAVAIQDISALWQAEALLKERNRALRESEERFRSVFEHAEVGVALSDLQGRLIECNPRFERMLGYTKPDLLQRGFSEFTYSDDVAIEMTLVQELIAGQRERYEVEKRYIRKDGQMIWVRLIGSVVRTEAGEPYLGIALVEDITGRKQVDESLRQQAEEIEKLMDLAPAAIWVSHDPGCYEITGNRVANHFYEAMEGENVSAGPEPGKTMGPRRFFRDGRELRADELPMQEAAAHNVEIRDSELDVLLPSGKWRSLLGSAVPLRDGAGQVRGCLAAFIDITARKQAEAQTRYQARLLENVSEAVISTGLDFTIRTWNQAAEATYGWTAAEAIGKVMGELVPTEYLNTTRAEVLKEFQEKGDWKGEVIQYCKDGSSRYILSSISIMKDERGRPEAVIAVNRDISERRQAEDALREAHQTLQLQAEELEVQTDELADINEQLRHNEQRWATTLASIGDAVIATDQNGLITFMNPVAEGLTGWRLAEVQQRCIEEIFNIVNEHTREAVESPVVKVLALGTVVGLANHTILIRKDGSEVPIDDSGAPIRDERGKTIGVVLVFRDITERKRTEHAVQSYARQLEQSNQELEDFAFVASHDLQEPLRKVELFGRQVIERGGPLLGETERDYLDRMVKAATRLRQMVDDLLELSRISSLGQPFVAVDLNRVARAVLDDLEIRIRQTNGQVQLGPLPVIQADPSQAYRLLQNLIGNALKFHRPGVPPLVKVSAQTISGHQLEIRVQDNGIGFSTEQTGRLFRPFQRLHGKAQYEGSGIGLSVCKKIVERHGGSIMAEGRPGEGATFIVILPA